MKLVITEKNDAAQKIADILAIGKPKADKVYNTPVYRFKHSFEDEVDEWVTIGLRGHILQPDFVTNLEYGPRKGWVGIDEEGHTLKAESLPKSLAHPPFEKVRKPFTKTGIDLKAWKMEALPYLIYAPIQKIPKEKDIIRSLKNLAKKADTIIIATDFDREGELIGSDALSCCLEVNESARIFRSRYSSFTKQEITEAFSNLVSLDTNLAHAGEARQEIDLIWGAVLTRYLTLVKFSGFGKTRSSGRVQTPTLALVVERERERMAFVPEPYWVIKARLLDPSFDGDIKSEGSEEEDAPEGSFEARHEIARFKSEAEAKLVMERLEQAKEAFVSGIEKKLRSVKAPIPFNTTSLMAAAANEGMTPKQTMQVAESLYMRGLISYPRVDNTVYPASLDLKEIVHILKRNPLYSGYAQKLLAQKQLTPTRGSKETTDHPPIYPTDYADSTTLSPSDWKLYNLIARRFLATLSGPAQIEGTSIKFDINGESFVAKGDVLVNPGYREIYHYGLKKDEELPLLHEGQKVAHLGSTCTYKETEPPRRYSQGTLIQKMEELGLGTKSTRHAIIDRLFEVKYVHNNPLEPSQLGMAVIDALEKFAPQITRFEMTSKLEEEMDSISVGQIVKNAVVDDSRHLLSSQLDNLLPHGEEIAEALSDAVAADAFIGICPQCKSDLQLKSSARTKSSFIGCSAWPECDVTYPVPQGKIEALDELCPECGMAQIKITAFRSKPQVRCIDPACPTNYEPDCPVGMCPQCKEEGREGQLIAQKNPKTLKRFIRCENYELCNTSYPLPANGKLSATEEVCDACAAPLVIVNTARGPWKFCPNMNCPKRETKTTTTKKTTKRTTKTKKSKS